MMTSPIYTRRMQRLLRFEGTGVETIFKGLQLDVGFAHQFMDVGYQLHSSDRGEFWLRSCGALADAVPMGDAMVRVMCHDIEDPTFDATAAATHPCMKMRPIHRPPRAPADRYPHCRWAVFIDGESKAFENHPNLALVQASKAANVPIDVPVRDAEPGGWADYSGPFDPGFQLEDLSHRALVIADQEFALQSHLLARGFILCSAQRFGEDAAAELAEGQWTGIAALTAGRLREPLGISGDDIEAVAKVFQMHPCFFPRTYVDFSVEITGPRSARIAIGDCPALEEGDPYSWFAGLRAAPHRALDAIAGAVNPRARCHPDANPKNARFAWDVVIDPSAAPQEEPPELKLARLSKGATFRLEQRRTLRN
jgi:hypothetical protein